MHQLYVQCEAEWEPTADPRVDLLPPFAYLTDVSERVSECCSASVARAENQTSGAAAGCSTNILSSERNRINVELQFPPEVSTETLEFTVTIAFPQGRKLRHLSTDWAER
jgi:hypothetical protein